MTRVVSPRTPVGHDRGGMAAQLLMLSPLALLLAAAWLAGDPPAPDEEPGAPQ